MSRFDNFIVQCLFGFLLMLVVSGCAPGSVGSGTGPSAIQPTGLGASPTALPTSGTGLPLVPEDNLITGVSFAATDVLGDWYDPTTKTLISMTANSIAIRQACTQFNFVGSWGVPSNFAHQVLGTITVTTPSSVVTGSTASVQSSNGRFVVALSSGGALYAQLINAEGATEFRLPTVMRAGNQAAVTGSCP
jgi:hypothetical protein